MTLRPRKRTVDLGPVSRREMDERFERLTRESSSCQCARPILDRTYGPFRVCKRCGFARRVRE